LVDSCAGRNGRPFNELLAHLVGGLSTSDVTAAGSEDDDCIAARIPPGTQRPQRGPTRNWEGTVKLSGRQRERSPIGVRAAHDHDQSVEPTIPLLEQRSAELGLDIAQPGHRLHLDATARLRRDGIRCPQVAANRKPDFCLPAPFARELPPEVAEQS
jgi:hypothetical protein